MGNAHKTFFRPVGLVHGPDASELVAREQAGRLGGSRHIGFTHVELVQRGGTRRIIPFAEVKDEGSVQRVHALRPSIAGLATDRTLVMGIVNVTPDSFSDGGKFAAADAAIAHGQKMALEGAHILDVGGESTRPGSDLVSTGDELARVIPVIEGLAAQHVVSCDTRKAAIMGAAAKAGARLINDVSALGHDAEAAGVVALSGLPVVLMHAQGEPKTMQLNPRYEDVALDVYDALEVRIDAAVAAGIARDRIIVDPGIGFGKTYRHNLDLMRQLTLFHGLGVVLLVGLSRKSLVGALTGEKLAVNRVAGSVGGALQAALMGAHILRVHDVKETVAALNVFTCGLIPDLAEL